MFNIIRIVTLNNIQTNMFFIFVLYVKAEHSLARSGWMKYKECTKQFTKAGHVVDVDFESVGRATSVQTTRQTTCSVSIQHSTHKCNCSTRDFFSLLQPVTRVSFVGPNETDNKSWCGYCPKVYLQRFDIWEVYKVCEMGYDLNLVLFYCWEGRIPTSLSLWMVQSFCIFFEL